jgi:ribosomal protein L24
VETEGFVDASNVMLVHPDDNKPSRVRIEERDGQRVRVFARGGDVVPDSSAI